MSQEDFLKQLDIASDLVKEWPAWKQNIVRDSLSPTIPVPREPVNNKRVSEDSNKTPKAGS